MPKTEGREDIDLVEIALEEEVTIDSTQLDTDELLDLVFGTKNEDKRVWVTLQVWRMMPVNLELAYMIWKTFNTITWNFSAQ